MFGSICTFSWWNGFSTVWIVVSSILRCKFVQIQSLLSSIVVSVKFLFGRKVLCSCSWVIFVVELKVVLARFEFHLWNLNFD